MILTFGYDGKGSTPAHLAKIMQQIDAVLIDVRLVPFSRIKGWGTNQLKAAIGTIPIKAALGARYISRKDLGGGNVKPAALKWLEDTYYHPAKPNCILLCKEENPGACHRHHEICADRFPDALHIFRDAFTSEADLDDLIEHDTDAEWIPLDDLVDFMEHGVTA